MQRRGGSRADQIGTRTNRYTPKTMKGLANSAAERRLSRRIEGAKSYFSRTAISDITARKGEVRSRVSHWKLTVDRASDRDRDREGQDRSGVARGGWAFLWSRGDGGRPPPYRSLRSFQTSFRRPRQSPVQPSNAAVEREKMSGSALNVSTGLRGVFERSPALREPRRTVHAVPGQTSPAARLVYSPEDFGAGRPDKGSVLVCIPDRLILRSLEYSSRRLFRASRAAPAARPAYETRALSARPVRPKPLARARCERTLSTADANRPGGRSTAAFGIPFRIWTLQKYRGRFIASRVAGLLLAASAPTLSTEPGYAALRIRRGKCRVRLR